MADRASAIILSNRSILLIHRYRNQREYFVFPGGNIEEGEDAESACMREVLEETGLQTAWQEFGFDYHAAGRMAHYFFVQVRPGSLVLGGPEAQRQSADNRYLLKWIPLARLGGVGLQPAVVRNALVRVLAEDRTICEARHLPVHRKRIEEILKESQPGA